MRSGSHKTRQVVDGLARQRLDRPYLRENGRLRPASWQEALSAVATKTKATPATKIGALVGDLAALEETFALKQLADKLGVVHLDCRQDGAGSILPPGAPLICSMRRSRGSTKPTRC